MSTMACFARFVCFLEFVDPSPSTAVPRFFFSALNSSRFESVVAFVRPMSQFLTHLSTLRLFANNRVRKKKKKKNRRRRKRKNLSCCFLFPDTPLALLNIPDWFAEGLHVNNGNVVALLLAASILINGCFFFFLGRPIRVQFKHDGVLIESFRTHSPGSIPSILAMGLCRQPIGFQILRQRFSVH